MDYRRKKQKEYDRKEEERRKDKISRMNLDETKKEL